MELRWDGVRSLKEPLDMLKEQAARTPEGQWIRVVGGWGEYQKLQYNSEAVFQFGTFGGDEITAWTLSTELYY